MATWDDVGRIALALPETSKGTSFGNRSWQVKDKSFAWERPLRKSDVEALGPRTPRGPVLAARVEHIGMKGALIAENPNVFFTTPHFNGYPAILVQLDKIDVVDLEELLLEAWLARAPKKLAKDFMATRQ